MITFTRAQIASVLATCLDFLVTILLVQVMGGPHIASSTQITFCGAIGTICGGIFHFTISRIWVFRAQDQKWHRQAPRYVLVWIGNLILNVSVLYLLTHYTSLNYLLAKTISAIGVAVLYNYTLQKRFVFR
jgi:putative flippase GtrA